MLIENGNGKIGIDRQADMVQNTSHRRKVKTGEEEIPLDHLQGVIFPRQNIQDLADTYESYHGDRNEYDG